MPVIRTYKHSRSLGEPFVERLINSGRHTYADIAVAHVHITHTWKTIISAGQGEEKRKKGRTKKSVTV